MGNVVSNVSEVGIGGGYGFRNRLSTGTPCRFIVVDFLPSAMLTAIIISLTSTAFAMSFFLWRVDVANQIVTNYALNNFSRFQPRFSPKTRRWRVFYTLTRARRSRGRRAYKNGQGERNRKSSLTLRTKIKSVLRDTLMGRFIKCSL